jgi:hypothetical protein
MDFDKQACLVELKVAHRKNDLKTAWFAQKFTNTLPL